jgi:hypothetical protein
VAIIVDERARVALARRRRRGQDAALLLRIAAVPHPGPASDPEVLWVGWLSPHRPRDLRGLVLWEVGAAVLFVDARLSRYTEEQDITLSAWRLGPFTRLYVVDQRLVLLAVQAGECRRRTGMGVDRSQRRIGVEARL